MKHFKITQKALLCAVAVCAVAAVQAQSFSFGLWGDMPYARNGDLPKMDALLQSINKSSIDFSIYDGDIKDGSSRCDDQVFADALRMFGKLNKPVIYVPGDNEWTDCHRSNNGGFDALERLSYLRKVMFATSSSLGKQTLPLTHQGQKGAEFYENTRFTQGKVVFVTLNVPGSNNNKILNDAECKNRSVRTLDQCVQSNAEYLARDAANLRWLEESFALAKQQQSAGIVVVIQADLGFDLPETESIDESKAPGVSGYQAFMAKLTTETAGFNGQVLFVHGDTHYFKIDKPLQNASKMLTNFTRIQTFGSPNIHWIKVLVDETSPNLFVIEPVIVKQ